MAAAVSTPQLVPLNCVTIAITRPAFLSKPIVTPMYHRGPKKGGICRCQDAVEASEKAHYPVAAGNKKPAFVPLCWVIGFGFSTRIRYQTLEGFLGEN